MNRAFKSLEEISNDRWDNIMNKLEIEPRYANSKKEILSLESLNYSEINRKLDFYRNMSIDWLENAIGCKEDYC